MFSTQTASRRKRNEGKEASQSDSGASQSEGTSSFCFDLNADFESPKKNNDINDKNDSIERPIGRKKEKMKKKQGDEMMQLFRSMKQENKQITDMFKESQTRMQETQDLMQKNCEIQLLRAQNESKKIELRK